MKTKPHSWLLCCSVLAMLGLLLTTLGCTPEKEQKKKQQQTTKPDVPEKLFKNWPKPDLALLISGEQHGYLLPCGCSRPQVGGLERRYNLLTKLRQAGWPVTAVDLGDIPQVTGPRGLPNVQGLLKYKTSMQALKIMGYQAVGVGQYETSFGLLNTLGAFRLEDEHIGVLSANLKEKENNFASLVESSKVVKVPGSRLNLGVTSVMSPTVAKTVPDRTAQFGEDGKPLPKLLDTLGKNGAHVGVLLYQGTAAEAKALVKKYPQFHVVIHKSDDPEPPSQATEVGNSHLISVGHKGKYVGIVGIYYTGNRAQPFKVRYQLVSLTEDFLTEKGEKNPVLDLMEKYTLKLKQQNYLSRYPRRKHPNQVAIPGRMPTYVGSAVCAKCHRREHKVWKDSKHSHAYDSLLTAKNPGNRQHDAECVVCHTVGFSYESGYTDATKTAHLKHVGCESCHGPGSEHIRNKYDEKWHKLMNPWRDLKGEVKKQQIDRFCQKCHDIDNDVHYKFEKRWPPIKH